MNLLELLYQRCKAHKAAHDLLDKAATESRGLTVTEQLQFDCLSARVQKLDHEIEERSALASA
jgi:hypothetical protein